VAEIDFFAAAKILRPEDTNEMRQNIPREFYNLLDQNKQNFLTITSTDAEATAAPHRGDRNSGSILKRLRAKEVRRCPQFTDEDEEFVSAIIRLLEDGALPKRTTQKVSERLKSEVLPLKILQILRRDIPREFLRVNMAQNTSAGAKREVVLSSFLVQSA